MINLVKRDEAYLQETRVNKKHTRKGIGTKLVNVFCREAKKRGIKEVFSEIEKEHVPFYINSCRFKDRGNHILIVKKVR
jgi:N-acetylglutamate synthase-like GNAT family acetyltransferase